MSIDAMKMAIEAHQALMNAHEKGDHWMVIGAVEKAELSMTALRAAIAKVKP